MKCTIFYRINCKFVCKVCLTYEMMFPDLHLTKAITYHISNRFVFVPNRDSIRMHFIRNLLHGLPSSSTLKCLL